MDRNDITEAVWNLAGIIREACDAQEDDKPEAAKKQLDKAIELINGWKERIDA